MNIVEFALKFKDLASGQFRKFGDQAQQLSSGLGNFANQVTGKNRVLGQSYNELQAKIKLTESTIRNSNIPSQIAAARRELAQLQSMSARHPGASMDRVKSSGSTWSQFGNAAFRVNQAWELGQKVYGMGDNMIGDPIRKALERQKLQTSFNVLAGSDKAGSALTNQLVALQKDTILGSEVFKNAQTMMGFGFQSTEVLSNLKMLGDVSMGDADKLGALTLAFSQTRAAGKMTGQDLLQYVNAGFNPLQEIAKRTGKSIGVLKQEMEGGNISFAMVQQAFKDATSEGGRFNNMLGKIAETPVGKVAQLSGAWDEFKVKLGTTFMPAISALLDFGSKMLPVVERFIEPLNSGVNNLVEAFRYLGPYINGMFSPIGNLFKNLVSDTAGWKDYLVIVKDLFSTGIYPSMVKLNESLSDMIWKLSKFVKESEFLKAFFASISQFFKNLMEGLRALIDVIKGIFDYVVMPILNGIEKVFRWIKGSKPIVESSVPKTAGFSTMGWGVKTSKKEDTNTSLIADNTKAVKDNTQIVAANEQAIKGGGQKILNITVQKFLDTIHVNSATLTEGISEIEGQVLEMFARVLAQGAVSN